MSVKKIGIVAFKIGLTVVAFVIAAGVAGNLGDAIGLSYSSTSIASILEISLIIPIWFGAPAQWRVLAATAGIAAGGGTC